MSSRIGLSEKTRLGPNLTLESLCLQGSPAHLCTSGDWSRAQWSLQATATELPMQTLTAGQSGNLDYRGVIGAALKLTGGDGPVQGTVAARLAGALAGSPSRATRA